MIEIIKERSQEYESFVENHPKGHIFQSYSWSKVKTAWYWRGIISRGEDGQIKGVMSLLLRKMPLTPYTLMYSPRGPVCDIADGDTIMELSDGAKKLAKEVRAYALKIDPDVKSDNEDFKAKMKAAGFTLLPPAVNFDLIQPQYVVRLDVKGKTREELMANFKSKWRYNIRVALKHEVTVEICGKEALDDFSRIMETTGERDDFTVRPRSYFELMYDALGENMRLYMASYEGKYIAGTLALHFGNKVWYLYGASSNEMRNLMPNYLLQWEMIQWAVDEGCDIYDFRGISGDDDESNPMAGLLRFKKGWGGEPVEFCGEFDYIYSPAAYKFIETMLPKARTLASKLASIRHRK